MTILDEPATKVVFNAEAIDRFAQEPTFVFPEGLKVVWDWDSAENSIRLDWSQEEGEVVASKIPTRIVGQANLSEWSNVLDNTTAFAQTQTVLARRAFCHPGKQGFVLKKLSHHQARVTMDRAYYSTKGQSLVPDSEQYPQDGWFAPAADPLVFGTLYLAPNDRLWEEDSGWAVWMIGKMDKPVATFAWNDEETSKTTIERILAADSEIELTVLALEDSEQLREDMKKHTVREAVLRGREEYLAAGNRVLVKPRLCESALNNAFTSCPPELKREMQYSTYRSTEAWTLQNREVFGWNQTAKRINAAVGTTFKAGRSRWTPKGSIAPEPMPKPERFDTFVKLLWQNTRDRKLGTIIRSVAPGEKGTIGFYIVRNIDLFVKYKAAFGVQADAKLEVLENVKNDKPAWKQL